MDSSKLVKFAIGLVLVMALLASLVSNTDETAPTDQVVTQASAIVHEEPVLVDPDAPVVRSTRREKKVTLSAQTKEARARQADEMERKPQDWGPSGLPPTDSVSTKVISSRNIPN